MADNITAPGAGVVFASDDLAGVQYPRVKVSWGAEGVAVDASASNPLPVTLGLTDAQLRATPVAVSGTVTTGGLTDAELRATALPVSLTGQSVGVTGSVAVTGTFWQATQPVSIASAVAVTPPTNATTTRAYSLANALRVAFTATSTTEAALPTMGASREIRFAASARCWVKWGATGLTAAAAEAASFVLEANAPEVIAMPAGATHFRVIRDTADGNLLMTPVA